MNKSKAGSQFKIWKDLMTYEDAIPLGITMLVESGGKGGR